MSDVFRDTLLRPGAAPLSWAQAGSGRDVVLIHGAIVTLEDMVLSLFPSLTSHARVTAFDRPGHGHSGHAGWTGSPWRQAAAIHDAVNAMGLERPVVVGHSFGAAVALAYALQFPRQTRGVVAVSPIAFPEMRLEHLVFAPRSTPPAGLLLNQALQATLDPVLLPALWNAMFLPQMMPDDYLYRFPFEVAGSSRQMSAEAQDSLSLNVGLARSALRYWRCQAPIEVIVGGADQVVSPAHGAMLSRLAPRARLTRLPRLGHMLHHFAPEVVAEAALRLSAAPRPAVLTPPARLPSPVTLSVVPAAL
jgi:pimeloyl-ACP methyl ester carboxylesterase